jgi:sugar phosphate isomerase/epimerase
LTAAGVLGSTGLIVVPGFNRQVPSLPHKEAREMLLRILPELGEHATKNNTRLLLEPLNRREAFFLRQLADAAAICKDVNNPGIAMMGDFWHMTWEETSDIGAFISAGSYLHHVHIASRKERKMPGEDPGDSYVDGFRGLKMIGYQDYISLECGSKGDKTITIPAAAKLIRAQWAQAAIPDKPAKSK